jgi:hypothetical protein
MSWTFRCLGPGKRDWSEGKIVAPLEMMLLWIWILMMALVMASHYVHV